MQAQQNVGALQYRGLDPYTMRIAYMRVSTRAEAPGLRYTEAQGLKYNGVIRSEASGLTLRPQASANAIQIMS